MLTFVDARTVAGVSVFRDVSWADGQRALTTTFYVLADIPFLATAPDGGPDYEFYCYRDAAPPTPQGGPVTAGGLLTLGVSATPGGDDLAGKIRAEYGLPGTAEVVLARVPVSSSTVTLTFAGEGGGASAARGGGEFTEGILGGGPAQTVSGNVTNFAVALTPDGAALLDTALAAGVATLHAGYDLSVPYVLDDISVRIWCDASAAARTAEEMATAGTLSPGSLTATITARQQAGATITSAHPLTEEESAELDAVRSQVLAELVPRTLLDDSGGPRPYSADLDSRLNVVLTATYPAVRTLHRDANLVLPSDLRRISLFDLASDSLLRRIQVSAPGDLDARGIASVAVRLDYHGTTADDAAVDRSVSALLRPDQPTAVLRLDLATPDQRTLAPHLDVNFADGSAPYGIDLPGEDGDVLVLDVDALGILSVDVRLGAVDPAGGASAIAEFGYGDDGAFDATLVLDTAHPDATWRAAVRQSPIVPYRRRVTWTRAGTRSTGDWEYDTVRDVRLDAPIDLVPPSSSVTLLSAGNFDAVSEIVIELRAGPDAPITACTFSEPDQSSTWSATAPLVYQLRRTFVPRGGLPQVGEWISDDRPILVVRDDLRFDLTVLGTRLDLGGAARKAVVELAGPDPSVPTTVVVLAPGQDRGDATVRLLDPGVPAYRYRLTVSLSAGPVRISDWLPGSSSILVLSPLA